MADDRLEPSPELPDISKLEDLEMPATVLFWRSSEESLCRHRHPLFCADIGLNVTSLTVDTLHALYLGVMNKWCSIVLWFRISKGVFGAMGPTEEQVRNSVLVMRHALMAWYGDYRQEHPSKVLTRLNDLTMKMLGTEDSPKCKTKGAETWGLLLFLIHSLNLHADLLGDDGSRLQRAGSALARLVEIWDTAGRLPSPSARQDSDREAFSTIRKTKVNQARKSNRRNG